MFSNLVGNCTSIKASELLKRIAKHMHQGCYAWSPIKTNRIIKPAVSRNPTAIPRKIKKWQNFEKRRLNDTIPNKTELLFNNHLWIETRSIHRICTELIRIHTKVRIQSKYSTVGTDSDSILWKMFRAAKNCFERHVNQIFRQRREACSHKDTSKWFRFLPSVTTLCVSFI